MSNAKLDQRLQSAVQSYWEARAANKKKQKESGRIDAGTRGEVTGGTQMGALEILVADILCEAGLERLGLLAFAGEIAPLRFQHRSALVVWACGEGRP